MKTTTTIRFSERMSRLPLFLFDMINKGYLPPVPGPGAVWGR